MGGCARRTPREKSTNSTCHGCLTAIYSTPCLTDFTHFEQVGPQLNRHTRYRPATTTRNTATQRSRRSMD